jgi:hypothetical protein
MVSTNRKLALSAAFAVAILSGCGGESDSPPAAASGEMTLLEDSQSVAGTFSAYDPEHKELRFRLLSRPAHGKVTLDAATGEFKYTPDADYFGDDQLRYAVSDDRHESGPAVFKFTVTPQPDPPTIGDISLQMSDPDHYPTRIALQIGDVDGDPLTTGVESNDTEVARVEMDALGNTVLVRPKDEGNAEITVTVSDGPHVVTKTFSFASLPAETTRRIDVASPTSSALVFRNVADFDVAFRLDVNSHMYPGTTRGETLKRMLESSRFSIQQQSAPFLIWQALSENTRRGATLSEATWLHGPVRLLSSLGFGYCDDVASAFAFLAKEAGMETRVWTLGGHVVPEVLVDGRWEMYDPDIGVIYHNRQGQVANLEELQADPSLITAPDNPILSKKFDVRSPFSQEVADIYSTTANNMVYDRYTLPVMRVDPTIIMPPGATLTFGGMWTPPLVDSPTGKAIPFLAEARLVMPAGWTGTLPSAFIVVRAEGAGRVKFGNEEFDIGSAELDAYLRDFRHAQGEPSIVQSDSPIAITLLVNALAGALSSENDVMVVGLNAGAIQVTDTALPQENWLNPAAFVQ